MRESEKGPKELVRGRKCMRRRQRRGGRRRVGEIQVLVLVVVSLGAVQLVRVRVMRVNMRGVRAGLKEEMMKNENQRKLEVELKGGDTDQEVVLHVVDMMIVVIF
jgi:hypothetical protein